MTSIATMHDSFGRQPSRAERFRRIILQEVLDEARRARMTPTSLLDIEPVRMAEYVLGLQPRGQERGLAEAGCGTA
jgi:hypothetical protein